VRGASWADFVKKREKSALILSPIVRCRAENEEDRDEILYRWFSSRLCVRRYSDRGPGTATDRNRARRAARISRTSPRLRGCPEDFRQILIRDRAWDIERRPHHAASRPIASGRVLDACARTGPRTPAPWAIAVARPLVEPARPNQRPPHLRFVTPSGSKPGQQHPTTTRLWNECPGSDREPRTPAPGGLANT
jgi:hypothetical protein